MNSFSKHTLYKYILFFDLRLTRILILFDHHDRIHHCDTGDKDSIEKIRIEILSRVKTAKKLKKIFNMIDLDKSNTIDRKEFHAFLTAASEVTTEDVLFEKIWNVVLGIGNEDDERKNDIALLGLKRWLFGSE